MPRFPGTFKVLHQSPTVVQLCARKAVALYCIAASHCTEYKYWWLASGRSEVAISTPVLWVNDEGMYHCRVVHHHKECTSQMISVTKKISGKPAT